MYIRIEFFTVFVCFAVTNLVINWLLIQRLLGSHALQCYPSETHGISSGVCVPNLIEGEGCRL